MFKFSSVSSFLALLLASVHVQSAPIPTHLRRSPWESMQARDSDSQVFSGGVATYYTQDGNAGACGQVNPDSALIAALPKAHYGDFNQVSPLCGKYIKITNTKNQKTVIVKIADACPGCSTDNSVDLSEGAFTQIATIEEGEVPITYVFVDGDDNSNTDSTDSGSSTDNGSSTDDGSGTDDGSSTDDDSSTDDGSSTDWDSGSNDSDDDWQ
ncbi:RlpA-like double-psi beta-barrel-protein domain-containing protein-containing protein [Lentinula raphanica]|nr:RlpA-like double-psi beta-barrel-protein domain-containing protein-containing protein [Lentinula raphanica]